MSLSPLTAPRLTKLDLLARIRGLPPQMQDLALLAAQHLYKMPVPAMQRTPEDQTLYDACRYDTELFATHFFPHFCSQPFCRMHQDFFMQYKSDGRRRGLRDVTAAPRLSAKTSIKAVIRTIQDCVYQHEKYILVVSARAELAEDKVKDIRNEIESNEAITRVYGPQRGPLWNQADFITAGGTRVRAASLKSQVRGLLWSNIRPTKLLFDDAEGPELVESETQRHRFRKRFFEDFSKLGDIKTNIDVIGTVLHPQSLLAILLENPGYRHHRYEAVLRFADNVALWQKWRDIFIDLANEHHIEDARAFFEAHEDEMLAGAEVLWPEKESYYDLMVMRLVEGDDAFWKEKQNQPQRSERTPFAMDAAGYCTVTPDMILRHDGRQVSLSVLADLVAFWDPAMGGTSGDPDWSCCVVVGRDHFGFFYVLDCYMAQHDLPDAQVEAVADLLWRWRIERVGLEANNFQALLVTDLREALAQKALEEDASWWQVDVAKVINIKAKHRRIVSIQPMVANRWLWFADHLHPEYYRQWAEFVPMADAGKDDGPDATESCIRFIKGIIDKRSAA